MPQPLLFTPYRLGSIEVRNRLWVAPMCMYSVEQQDGVPTDWHLVHLGSMASGGAGLVMAEATAVVPEGRISPWDLGIWNDAQRDAFRRITAFIAGQGAVPAIQLAHAGRKASTYREWADARGSVPASDGGWQTVAPSPLPSPGLAEPRALTAEEIERIPTAFAEAAVRSVDAGFAVLELHAAHGYLLHQFLSPLSNERTDEWGGSLENRARLLLAVIDAVRTAVGGRAELMVRVSATDWLPGGWDEAQTAIVAGWAVERGVALIDVSSGGLLPASVPVGPGYQVHLAQGLRESASVPAGAVGLITRAQQAEDVLQEGRADVVLAGREFLRDPHWAQRAASELGAEPVALPPQYRRAPWPASARRP